MLFRSGGGLAAGFSSSNQVLGVRKTTDFLEKATWSLIAFIVVLSIVAGGIRSQEPVSTNDSEIQRQYQQAQETVPGVINPGFEETPEAE